LPISCSPARRGGRPGGASDRGRGELQRRPCGFVQDDDVALIWLQDQSQTAAVARYLNANAKALFIDEVMAGAELKLKFRRSRAR